MTLVSKVTTFKQLHDQCVGEVRGHFLGRVILWSQKAEDGRVVHLCKQAFLILAATFLALTLVGIPVIMQAVHYKHKLADYAQLTTRQDPTSLPSLNEVITKTQLATFDFRDERGGGYEYTIHQGLAWFKPIGSQASDWQLFYFDGYAKGLVPTKVYADGCNVVIIDQLGGIHYRKSWEEERHNWDDKTYKRTSLMHLDNWYDRWFTRPGIVEPFYNLYAGKVLHLPGKCIGYAMSHRGYASGYWEDRTGRKRPEFAYVTTGGAICEGTSDIFYSDPYLTGGFRRRFKGPEHFTPVANGISASASTFCLMGKDESTGQMAIRTRLVDFDMGTNPFLPAFWSKNWAPVETWQDHPIDFAIPQGCSLANITIYQTGVGNDSRELRVDLVDNDGLVVATYEKRINEAGWMLKNLSVESAST